MAVFGFVITLIAIAVSVFLFWLNNHNIKINTIRYLRDVNISNLKYAISTLKDLKNENKIIKYKIIDTEEIIILKMVQSWNGFGVDT